MALVTAVLNTATDAAAADLDYLSLHTGDPSTTGANEASGGSPAYARKALTWGSASSGEASATEVTFDVPADTYTHLGVWSAATSGTFLGGAALDTSQVISSQGEIKVTVTLTATAG